MFFSKLCFFLCRPGRDVHRRADQELRREGARGQGGWAHRGRPLRGPRYCSQAVRGPTQGGAQGHAIYLKEYYFFAPSFGKKKNLKAGMSHSLLFCSDLDQCLFKK